MEAVKFETFKKFISGREDLWEVVFRNGYVLPKVSASIYSEDYLMGVLSEAIFCPKDVELKCKNCYAPHTKQIMIDKLAKIAAKKMNINLGIDQKHIPDKQWMIKILAHLDQKDEIFSKDYTPSPVKKKKDSPKIIMIPTGLLKNLPIKSI